MAKDEIVDRIGQVCAYMWTSSSATLGYFIGSGTSGCGGAGVLESTTTSYSGRSRFDAACCDTSLPTASPTSSPTPQPTMGGNSLRCSADHYECQSQQQALE